MLTGTPREVIPPDLFERISALSEETEGRKGEILDDRASRNDAKRTAKVQLVGPGHAAELHSGLHEANGSALTVTLTGITL